MPRKLFTAVGPEHRAPIHINTKARAEVERLRKQNLSVEKWLKIKFKQLISQFSTTSLTMALTEAADSGKARLKVEVTTHLKYKENVCVCYGL